MELRVGAHLGDYEILGHVGAGGSGAVYRARHCLTGRIEAIKVLHTGAGDATEQSERFMREIRVQASLQHPNIAAVHNAQWFDGRLVMVMEYVDGASLRELIDLGLLPLENVIGIACQALDALEYAHNRELVHRDIKPENILITADGLVKLTDFGLAKVIHNTDLTATAAPRGSMWYISPEQIQSARAIDGRADIYSLGAVLYEMATGRPPFAGESFYELMKGHVERTPRPPIEWNRDIPEDLNLAILVALEKSPELRFASAAEFRRALLFSRGENRLPSPASPKVRRRLAVAALAGAVMALASVGAWQRGRYEIPLSPAASAGSIRPPEFAYQRTARPERPPLPVKPPDEPESHMARSRASAPEKIIQPEAPPPNPEESTTAGLPLPVARVELVPVEPAVSLPLPPAPSLQPGFELIRTLPGWEAARHILLGSTGRCVAAFGARAAKVWDISTGRLLLETPESRETLTAIALSAREDRLLTGDGNGTVRVWDLRSEREPAALGHPKGVTALAAGADGEVIVSLKDKTIHFWRQDESDGKYKRAYRSLKGRAGRTLALAFNPAENRLVTAAEDNRMEVWEAVGGGKPVRIGTGGGISNVVLSRDGLLIGAAGSESVSLWHVPTRRQIANVPTGGRQHAVAFSPHRRCVAVAGGGRTLRLWDVTSGSPLAEAVVDAVAADVSIADDTASIVALDVSGRLYIWRLNEAAGRAVREPFTSDDLAALVKDAPARPAERQGVLKRLSNVLPFGSGAAPAR